MGNWHRKESIKVFWKLQKNDGMYWLLEISSITIMSLAMYLFLFFSWLYKCFSESTQSAGEEFGNILEFSQQSLHILIVCCVFIGIFTLQSLCYFRTVKNQRRSAVLRVLGMQGKWLVAFDIMEAIPVVIVSFFLAFSGAQIVFSFATKDILGTEQLPTIQSMDVLIQIFFVSMAMFALLLISYRIAGIRESHKTMGEQLRGTEHQKKKEDRVIRNRLFFFFAGIYLIILFAIAEEMQTIFIGTVILFLLGLCNYVLSLGGVKITEKLINKFRRNNGYKAEFLNIALQTGGVKNKSVFLITIVATSLLLFYFLSSIDWGIESFLERFWIQSRQTNLYLECQYGEEQDIEKWLNDEGVVYNKLHIKELQQEGLTLAVSECRDENSPYYVREGHMRTILYNLYRWGVSAGDRYSLSQKEFIIDEPMKEEGFQLISYTCLVNYEDWENQLDKTYTTVFAMYADKETFPVIKAWTDENGVGMMNASHYMDMVKQIYAPYLRMLKIILLILSFSILLFLFSSILSNIITREKEFLVYRGCGIGWGKIKRLVMAQFLYIAFLASIISAVLYCLIFNGFKLLWFGNSTVYFVAMRQLLVIVFLVLSLIGFECHIAMKFMQKRNGNAIRQLRAE